MHWKDHRLEGTQIGTNPNCNWPRLDQTQSGIRCNFQKIISKGASLGQSGSGPVWASSELRVNGLSDPCLKNQSLKAQESGTNALTVKNTDHWEHRDHLEHRELWKLCSCLLFALQPTHVQSPLGTFCFQHHFLTPSLCHSLANKDVSATSVEHEFGSGQKLTTTWLTSTPLGFHCWPLHYWPLFHPNAPHISTTFSDKSAKEKLNGCMCLFLSGSSSSPSVSLMS